MKVINLLPKTEHREIKLQLVAGQVLNFWIYAGLSLVILFILALATLVLLRGQISGTDNAIAEKKKVLASSDTQKLESSVVGLNNDIRMVNTISAANYHWSEALLELTYLTPEGVHLSAVDFNRASNKIQVSGIADTREAVIAFWSNVKKSQYFRNINFPFTNLEKENNAAFTYTFYLNSEQIKNESPK